MKKAITIGIVLAMLAVAGPAAFARQSSAAAPAKASETAQTAAPDRVVVPLSNPSLPARIEASIMRGSITVKGYGGKDVTVEARIREKAVGPEFGTYFVGKDGKSMVDRPLAMATPDPAMAAAYAEGRNYVKVLGQKKEERSHEGMKLITAPLTGLQVEEEDNTVRINTESWKYAIDLTIQVPVSSSLELRSMNDGDIVVENVSGNLEVQNQRGVTTLRDVSGNIVANSVTGDIEAVMSRVATDKPLAFSTMNGDIDVTFPADLKASVKLKIRQGNIYSDFDVALKQAPQKIEEASRPEGGKYRISFEKGLYGLINGGGREISFSSAMGNVYIRKKK